MSEDVESPETAGLISQIDRDRDFTRNDSRIFVADRNTRVCFSNVNDYNLPSKTSNFVLIDLSSLAPCGVLSVFVLSVSLSQSHSSQVTD